MKHFILFTGHMIDKKDRIAPRFPASKENIVRQEIYKHLLSLKERQKGMVEGIASGACGGDILFHEVCVELNIPSHIYLAMPAKDFKKNSVSFAGNNWIKRFDKLIEKLDVHVLAETERKNGENAYQLTNDWMLNMFLEAGSENMTLLALWDGSSGDGKGGTEHMIKKAKEKNAEVDIIDINKLLELGS